MRDAKTEIKTIFLEALECKGADELMRFLEKACGADSALRMRVHELLRAHRDAGAFLGGLPSAEAQGGPENPGGAPDATCDDAPDNPAIDFLTPSEKPGSIGRLGHYEVLEVLGHGGMGIVLRAFDEKLHRVVAIKVMAAQLAINATARKRFTREARAQAAVCNDNVVTIFAVEEASLQPYFVMQFVAGLSLKQRLDRDGPQSVPEILRIGMQTASALAAAHAQGLVHRDIKPANILLENGVERVKVTDFGLARAGADASLTQSGVVTGTPQYMSPEQADGRAIDLRTDLFSLGSVLYAMCTGRAPFRASSSMAVLKRVCEETPALIQDTNSEMPDWLVAIVNRLHAKEPAERFQSAAEVAALLGQHLAHVQHPSVVEQVSSLSVERPAGWKSAPRRRRLAVIGALVLLLGSLSLTEATGVSNLRATVIRIFTPGGTLVVEVDDPGVKVTIEGDGGLVITGAGLEEFRLRPGSYKIQADKDGKRVPLERDLVSIAKGGREVVKVKLEAPPAETSAKAEKGAFVLLASGKERKFDTLAEAVQGASDGDTIEVRGNGPFVSNPIVILGRALMIRAGEGFQPVIQLNPEWLPLHRPLLNTNAALVLEGLELQYAPDGQVVHTHQSSLEAANCRFRGGISTDFSPVCVFRNCVFLPVGAGRVFGRYRPGARLTFENCLCRAGGALIVPSNDSSALDGVSIQIKRSTFVSLLPAVCPWLHRSLPVPSDPPQASKPIRLEVSGCVLDVPNLLGFDQSRESLGKAPGVSPAASESPLLRVFEWRGEQNVFAPGSTAVWWRADSKVQPPHGPKSLEEWTRVWGGSEANSLEGHIRFQGGNLFSRAPLTQDDFRLLPDSAGYRAGKDGKDLGADVDLVGPGPAYERWKKTPEYQQWLKETAQLRAEAPKPEPQAFVVLGANGIELRKFHTLAEAVSGAGNGGTIEVRGDGPFQGPPNQIRIDKKALVIRAGPGFHPVLVPHPEMEQADHTMLLAFSVPLTLEGLEFRRSGTSKAGMNFVYVMGSPCRLLNCRFVVRGSGTSVGTQEATAVEIRNCEFFRGGPDYSIIHAGGAPLVMENCVLASPGPTGINLQLWKPDQQRSVLRLRHNTFALGAPLRIYPKTLGKSVAKPFFQVHAAGNLFDDGISFDYGGLGVAKLQLPAQGEQLLKEMVTWEEQGNLWASDVQLLQLQNYFRAVPATQSWKSLADWEAFWGLDKTGSLQGRFLYQNGNPVGRLASDQLSASDFRLAHGSPGKGAAPDGRDLGADVDLVGPGAAYERWKKTAEYQQWLNDSGQKK